MTSLTASSFRTAAYRHAAFYLRQLQHAHSAYTQSSRQGLAAFDEHWSQIHGGFSWLRQHTAEPDAASLCGEYIRHAASLLSVRRPIAEQIDWFTVGLESARMTGRRQDEADILNLLGQAYLVSKGFDASRSHYEQALAIARDGGYAKQEADALVGLGRLSIPSPPQADAARDMLTAAQRIYERIGDLKGQGWTLQNLGTLEDRHNRLDAAEAYMRQALDIAVKLGDTRFIANACRRLGSIADRQGDRDASLRYTQHALDAAREAGDLDLVAACLMTAGLREDNRGDKLAARAMFEEALDNCRKSGHQLNMALAHMNLGWITADLGDLSASLAHHRASGEMYGRIGHQFRYGAAQTNVGFTMLRLGMTEEAATPLADALHVLASEGGMHDWMDVLLGFAWLMLRRGDAERCAQIVGMVTAYPPDVMYPERLAFLRMVQAELDAALPPDVLHAANAAGAALHPDAVRDAIVAQFPAPE